LICSFDKRMVTSWWW